MNSASRQLFPILTPPLLALACIQGFPALAPFNISLILLLALLAGGGAGWYFLNREQRQREEKFQRIFDFSPDYMIVGRLQDGLIIEANEGFERFTGYKRSEAIGKTTLDLGLWRDVSLRTVLFEELRHHALVHEFPTQLQRQDGGIRDALCSAATFKLGGESYYVAILRDITEELRIQKLLTASETRFKTIFEAAPTPIAINRVEDFTFISVNPAWEALYGLKSSQVIGKTLTQCGYIPRDIDSLRTQTAILLSCNRLDSAEADFLTPSGRHVAFIYSSRVIELEGKPVMVSINTDITRLRETENRLKAIVEAAPFPITITRLADHAYLQVNTAFEQLVNLPATSILGKTRHQVGFRRVHPDFLRQQTDQLLATGELNNAQTELIDPSGRQMTLMYSSRVIELNGEPAIISISSDISQLKSIEAGLRQAEAARTESEARFAALFHSSPIPLGVFRAGDGQYIASELNAVWYDSFGYAPEQIIDHSTQELGFWTNEADRQQLFLEIDKNGSVRNLECWLRRADGSRMLCSISASLIISGEQRMLLAAYLDVTEKHQVEAEMRELNSSLETRIQDRTRELQLAQANLIQSEKMASLGSLVAGIAHELNSPIGNSLTVATTLADRTKTLRHEMKNGLRRSTLDSFMDDAHSGTSILTRNLQRAAELVQSFKSIAVDQASDQRRRFDLRQIMEETLMALGPSLKRKPYQVTLEIEEGLDMDSYPGPLEQVAVNLINNAILHGFDGRESGSIEIRGKALGNERIRLSLVDDGIGIIPANLSRIFDPFFTTKLGQGGSGLGLHIVRSIIEQDLGGTITVSSEPGQGTRMDIDLPRQAPLVPQRKELCPQSERSSSENA